MIEILRFILWILFYLFCICLVYLIITIYRIVRAPKSFPSKFLKKNIEKDPSNKRIVLIGDSITHGTVGYNYVKAIKKELEGETYEIINAGLNGDLTINILERIEDIIKCEPDFITILIGTNDAIGSYSVKDRKNYVKTKGARDSAEFWTLERFKEDYTKIIAKLKAETQAEIGVLSIPIMGEDLKDPVMENSIAHSEIIKEISKDLGVYYMPLNEQMIDYLKEHPSNQKYEYRKKLLLMIKALFAHYFGRSWQHISIKNGFQLLIDNIHLSEKGASFVIELIESFIEKFK